MTETPFHIVIPARYASSRFPGKPLVPIAGKPMIDHVVDRARETTATTITVATDDRRIYDHCKSGGVTVVMTDSAHATGTDRICEVVKLLGWSDDQIVVCLQGDEPATPVSIISQVASNLARQPDASIATLCAPITEPAEFLDANRVKVVFDSTGYALYFSRAPIPHRREPDPKSALPDAFVHIGIYAYRCDFLRKYQALSPHPLETEERLEQLRALANGYRIHVDVALDVPAHGVDTPDDIEPIERILLQA